MAHRHITLSYRKLIDATATRPWDKLVFDDSYAEFRLQMQQLDPARQHRTFGQLVQHTPAAAEKLPFLVSAAVRGYVQQLQGVMPDIADNQGRLFMRFSQFQLEIIDSDVIDRNRHQIGIVFYSDPFVWHDTVGPYLLLSSRQPAAPGGAEAPPVLTTLFQLQPYVSIHSLQVVAASSDD